MKILVIFTGGTIGSMIKDGWISTDQNTKYLLIRRYQELSGDCDTEFQAVAPYTVLSENLSYKELTALSRCVEENLEKEFDGIIITHGTDSLQYTAAALAYQFSDCKLPVVLVSSAYPLEDNRENGTANFYGAVRFICASAGTGIFVSYKNADEDRIAIHRGTRISAHGEAEADVCSIDDQPYAFCEPKSGQIRKNPKYHPSRKSAGTGAAVFCDYPEILWIHSHPGDGYQYALEGCKAVILSPYHSGTLNTASERFRDFCIRAKNAGIPVFVADVMSGITYKSSELYEELGLIVLPLCTGIAVYMKCWLAISRNVGIRQFAESSLAEEFCDHILR